MNPLQHHGYYLGDTIGKGTFSKVVRACKIIENVHENVNEKRIELACKIIDRQQSDTGFISKFFPRELEILAKLKPHPNLIAIHSILERKKIVYIFMRWAEKGDLLTWMRAHGTATENQANLWFFQMVSAVKYLHSLGYAHRDIKPENIFLSANYNIKIGDFGFVRQCEDNNKKPIMSETFCGSEAYAAPEIIQALPYDPKKSDIYALGAVLYTLLAGKNPYDTRNHARALKDQRVQKFVDIAFLEQLSNECVNLIHKLMKFDPRDRPDIETVYNSPWLRKRAKNV